MDVLLSESKQDHCTVEVDSTICGFDWKCFNLFRINSINGIPELVLVFANPRILHLSVRCIESECRRYSNDEKSG